MFRHYIIVQYFIWHKVVGTHNCTAKHKQRTQLLMINMDTCYELGTDRPTFNTRYR